MGNKPAGGKQTNKAAAVPTTQNAAPAAQPAAPAAPVEQDKSQKHEKYNMTIGQYEQHYQGWLSLAENGRIKKQSFVDKMVASGVDKEMAEILFDTYDSDGSGDVDVDEFLGLVALTLNGTGEDQIRASFKAFDKDHNGSISKDELRLRVKTLLRTNRDGTPRTLEELEAAMKEAEKVLDEVFELIDTDKSGSIDIEEYTRGFAQNPKVTEFIHSLQH